MSDVEQTGGRPRAVAAVVIGAGFAGIDMARALRKQGITDFVIVERGADVGGTWRDNTYPGATCDVPSNLYSFSWALNPNWSRSFSPQPEIQTYLRTVARREHVYDNCLFDTEVQEARWDDAALRWRVSTSRGEFVTPVLISGAGALCEPKDPDIAGLQTFAGTTFHSARWNHDVDLAGKRVAVVGTGASAVQLVPEVAKTAGHLDVYQRTASWVLPRKDKAFKPWEKWAFAHVPGVQRAVRASIYWARELFVFGFAKNPKLTRPAQRIAEQHLERQVPDGELRETLRPTFTIGCKRILLSNTWYPTLQRDNVDLVTAGIDHVTEDAVVTADGVRHPADVIIFATGFHVTDMPIAERIVGADGVSLAKHWADGAQAHRGTTVAGYPNLFFIVGPNTGLGHSSMIYMIEAQVRYIAAALSRMRRDRLAAVAPLPAAQDRFNADLQQRLGKSVWNSGGCRSWYLNSRGENTTIWPDFTFRFRQATAKFDPSEYETTAEASK